MTHSGDLETKTLLSLFAKTYFTLYLEIHTIYFFIVKYIPNQIKRNFHDALTCTYVHEREIDTSSYYQSTDTLSNSAALGNCLY